MSDKVYTYTIRMEPAEEGGFDVLVPALPGCHTQAETFEEAVDRAKGCIEGFLESLVKAGEPIPVESQAFHSVTLGIQVKLHQRT